MQNAPSVLPDRLLIGMSGAGAAVIMPSAIAWMKSTLRVADIRVVMTRQAAKMIPPETILFSGATAVFTGWKAARSAVPIPHVELGRWAKAFLIMPATANILAKAVQGIADDLLTTCILASDCPVVFSMTMNDIMWRKRAVQRNVRLAEELGYYVVPPSNGYELQSGRQGFGSMPPLPDMVAAIGAILNQASPEHWEDPNVLVNDTERS